MFFFFLVVLRVTNLYNMLPVRTAGQFEVLLLVIRYAKEAKLVVMLASFFAGVDEWIKVKALLWGIPCRLARYSPPVILLQWCTSTFNSTLLVFAVMPYAVAVVETEHVRAKVHSACLLSQIRCRHELLGFLYSWHIWLYSTCCFNITRENPSSPHAHTRPEQYFSPRVFQLSHTFRAGGSCVSRACPRRGGSCLWQTSAGCTCSYRIRLAARARQSSLKG